MKNDKTTPMMKQYFSIKEKYPEAILFYRMGDFFEMFYDDAKIASKILEIALTSRSKKDENRIPMCGIPHRAANTYIARLIEHGHKVAVCEQVEDASQAKGIVKREVVRVVTPGMLVENEFLKSNSNNFIISIFKFNDIIGLSCLDISTATFRVTESFNKDEIIDEARRINPSECIIPDKSTDEIFYKNFQLAFSNISMTKVRIQNFNFDQARQLLINQFKVRSLEGFGCEKLTAATGAAGALLNYVLDTQKKEIPHILKLETINLKKYLLIDDNSSRNLELLKNIKTGAKKGSLISILDQTKTSMGFRLLKKWLMYPLINKDEINKRLNAVYEAYINKNITHQIREALNSIYDMERLLGKISLNQCNAPDLISLKGSINKLPEIWKLLFEFKTSLFQEKPVINELLDLSSIIENAIKEDSPPGINEGGFIKDGYNKELDELISISRDGKGYIASLEAKEKEETGINSIKVRYNKVFGYYIEVPKKWSDSVPMHYIRKQTLVNAERYITDDLKTFEEKVLGAEEKRAKLEYELFCQLRDQILEYNKQIQEAADFVALCDCIFNFAFIANQNDYIKPDINDNGILYIEEGRHPVVEKLITGERFVPNTIEMDDEKNQIFVITGPNMAGKSTILRQTAIIVLMAQIGSFIPAKSGNISISDRIFTRVGAWDNLSEGQSTFMLEMEETAYILNTASPKSLIIMDEIGRGTSTYDGVSIAWAVAEFLHDYNGKGIKTLFATHYHELIELARLKNRIKNYNIAVKESKNGIIFLRKLQKGGVSQSYGIEVAKLAGIPQQVIQRSNDILKKIEEKHNYSNNFKNFLNNNDSISLDKNNSIASTVSSNTDIKTDNETNTNLNDIITETNKNVNTNSQNHIPAKNEMIIKNKKTKKIRNKADRSYELKQMYLFKDNDSQVVKELKKIDISAITPLQALNYLNDLKKLTAP